MNKKHVVILVVLTNVISISFVLLILNIAKLSQKSLSTTEVSELQSNETRPKNIETEQSAESKIDDIIAKYDVIKHGQYKESVEKYKLALRNEPVYSVEPTTAYAYAKNGDYSKAIEVCEKDIQDFPNSPIHLYVLAWINAKIGNYEKAVDISRKTIKLNPKYSRIWHILAWVHVKLGEHEKAIDACNQSLKLDPHSAEVHYGLGRLLGILERNEEAIESYKKAVQLKSNFAQAYLFLGLTYAELGDLDEAIKFYNKAVFFDSDYSEAYYFLGAAYDESGQYRNAAEALEKAITFFSLDFKNIKIRIHHKGIRPNLANLYCTLGLSYLRINKLTDAFYVFNKAIEIDEAYARAHYGLALTHLLLGDKDAAFEEYEVVKKLEGEEIVKPLYDIITKFK